MNNDTLLPFNGDLGLGDLNIDDSDDDQTATAASVYDVDTVEQQFEICLQDAKRVPNSQEDRKNFAEKRHEKWSQTTRNERRNFLHFLAYLDRNSRSLLPWLMSIAIFLHPTDMGVLDTFNRTPLSAAITVGNQFFVNACMKIFRTKPEKGRDIQAALEKAECVEQDEKKDVVETCLHVAINHNLKPESIKSIIENVSEKTFRMQDHKGRTPLHLAVDYEKCSPPQVDIVSHLLRFGSPHALTVKMKKDSMGPPRSAYQHHEMTRKLFVRNNPEKSRIMEQERAQDMKRDEGPNSDWELLADEKKKKASSRISGHLRKDNYRRPDLERPGLIRQGVETVSPTTQETSTPQDAFKPIASEVLSYPDGQQAPLKSTNLAILQSQQTAENQREEQKANADEIREQLKLSYLRTTKPSVALHCLQMQDEKGMKSPIRTFVFSFF